MNDGFCEFCRQHVTFDVDGQCPMCAHVNQGEALQLPADRQGEPGGTEPFGAEPESPEFVDEDWQSDGQSDGQGSWQEDWREDWQEDWQSEWPDAVQDRQAEAADGGEYGEAADGGEYGEAADGTAAIPSLEDETRPERDDTPRDQGLLWLLWSPVGRLNRSGFLTGVLFLYAIANVILLAGLLATPYGSAEESRGFAFAYLALFASAIMLGVKRAHDMDWSGFSVLLMFFCGPLFILTLALSPGSRYWNRFGPLMRHRWNVASIAFAILMGISGVYSMIIYNMVERLDKKIEVAYDAFQKHRLNTAQTAAVEIYEQAESGSRLCAVCGHFTVYGMLSASLTGQVLLEERKWPEAKDWLIKAQRLGEALDVDFYSERDRSLVDVRIHLAEALEQSGEFEDAAVLREKALQELDESELATSSDPALKFSRGLLCLQQQQYDKAEAIYGELIEADVSRMRRRSLGTDAQSQLGANYHNRAVARYNLGNLSGAEADLREAVRVQTKAHEATLANALVQKRLALHWSLLASVHWEEGDTESDVIELEKSLEFDPNNFETRAELAALCYQEGEFDRIVKLLSDFVTDRRDLNLEYMLSLALLHQDDFEQAETAIQRLEQQFPDTLEGHFLTGVLQLQRGQYSAAVEALQRAAELQPADAGIWHNLALSLFHAERRADADRTVLILQDIDPQLAAEVRRYFADPDSSRSMPTIMELTEF